MTKCVFTKPRFLRGFVNLFIIFLFSFQGCVSNSEKTALAANFKEENNPSHQGQYKTITFKNNTFFRLNITIGSMARGLEPINPGKSLSIPNIYPETEIYYISFDIPLLPLSENYDLLNVKPNNTISHFRIGKTDNDQNIQINIPDFFDDIKESYIVFKNNGNTGGISLSDNRFSRLNCIHKHSKDNINQDETEIFQIKPGNKKLYISGSINLEIPELNYQPSFVYYFTYEANKATLTDARPLHRAGESGWVKTLPDATGPMPLVTAENEIFLFTPTEKGLVRNAYDSSGNDKAPVPSGDSFDIRFASPAQDGFFIAGYEELTNGDNKPVARIHDKNGGLRSILAPSKRRDSRSAYFTGAGQKDTANWLLFGGSRENPAQGYRAYARQVRDVGSPEIADLWELAGDDFDAKSSGVKCGNITAAVYARSYWLVAGEILAFDVMGNPVKASFTAEISNEGKIQKIDTSFKNMTFNKIVMDSNGSCYLVGDEQRGNENFAILVKYGANARQTLSQPASHSFYHDAVIDALYNRIILTGTLRAKNEIGNGGVPFIDAVDIEKGSLLWREELSDVLFNKASVVTAINPAPDYGFVITLCGISDYYDKPYKIARINSQGKLIKELQK